MANVEYVTVTNLQDEAACLEWLELSAIREAPQLEGQFEVTWSCVWIVEGGRGLSDAAWGLQLFGKAASLASVDAGDESSTGGSSGGPPLLLIVGVVVGVVVAIAAVIVGIVIMKKGRSKKDSSSSSEEDSSSPGLEVRNQVCTDPFEMMKQVSSGAFDLRNQE
jgi:hypothetical protein